LLGAMIPYWFAALTMGAVAKTAGAVVMEVRRQFKETVGLLAGAPGVKADHVACVELVTHGAMYYMVFPALLVVLSPLVIGIGLGPQCLAGLLLGAISSGFVLGAMMNSAGGAWDNAKKYAEAQGLKRTDQHKACVVGDTVGDPFKDTTGPAINILIKLMSYISVVLVPVFKNQVNYWWVALIILGVMAIFVPVWISRVPEGLSDEDRLKMVTQKNTLAVNADGSLVVQENPLASPAMSAAASSASSKGNKAVPSAVVTADFELFKQFNQFQQFQQFQQMKKQGQVVSMAAPAPAVEAVAAMAATDAGVWVEQRNADTGRVFYVNSVTKEQTWIKPEGLLEMQTLAKP